MGEYRLLPFHAPDVLRLHVAVGAVVTASAIVGGIIVVKLKPLTTRNECDRMIFYNVRTKIIGCYTDFITNILFSIKTL